MKMKSCYLGVDVGSVSTNIILLDDKENIIYKKYLRTKGRPIPVLQDGIKDLIASTKSIKIIGVGATGSGRQLANTILGADIVKNEITAHAVSGIKCDKDVQTIIEIGGQDSKIIIIRNGIVTDFAMNTVCAAGTGSFLDRQASRLGIEINEFGKLALSSLNSVRIAGRCAVFAESDMIHKQQLGHNQEDIAKGLCEGMVRNYLSNVGKGKEILGKVLFQGGVAANQGIKKAFEDELNLDVVVPVNYDVMGALGVALLAKEEVKRTGRTRFKGINIVNSEYIVKGSECNDCSNMCEVIEISEEGYAVAKYGDRCGKWSNMITNKSENPA